MILVSGPAGADGTRMKANRRIENPSWASGGGVTAATLVVLGAAALSLAALSGPAGAAPVCECEDTTIETTVPETTVPDTTAPESTQPATTVPDTTTAVLPATTEFLGPTAPAELPRTGTSTVPAVVAGGLLVAAGAAVLSVTARRRAGDGRV
jgi:LPXTG-motif cell wall-anchored protein